MNEFMASDMLLADFAKCIYKDVENYLNSSKEHNQNTWRYGSK